MWVPQGLSHTVLNMGQVLGVSMQSTVLPYDLLLRAAYNDQADAVRWLLTDGGMLVNAKSPFEMTEPFKLNRGEGGTALHLAAMGDAPAAVAALSELGADMEARNAERLTPLMVAAREGNTRALRALLDAGAEAEALDARRHAALQHAALGAVSVPCIRAILAAGASTELTKSTWRMSVRALQAAAQENRNELQMVERELRMELRRRGLDLGGVRIR